MRLYAELCRQFIEFTQLWRHQNHPVTARGKFAHQIQLNRFTAAAPGVMRDEKKIQKQFSLYRIHPEIICPERDNTRPF